MLPKKKGGGGDFFFCFLAAGCNLDLIIYVPAGREARAGFPINKPALVSSFPPVKKVQKEFLFGAIHLKMLSSMENAWEHESKKKSPMRTQSQELRIAPVAPRFADCACNLLLNTETLE